MSERYKLKITVLKNLSNSEIFGGSPPFNEAGEACDLIKVGQEFSVNEDGRMPEGFYTWAWNDIYSVVTTLRFIGDFPWMKEKGTNIACCTDGLRPVIFEIKRI